MLSRVRACLVCGLLTLVATNSMAAAAKIDGARARELEALVRQDCGSCHGMTLKGGLGPELRAARLASRSVRNLANIILDGVPGTPMPPWRPLLSDDDAVWIAGYLKDVSE